MSKQLIGNTYYSVTSERQFRAARNSELTKDAGATGTEIFGDRIDDSDIEANTEWRDDSAIKNIRKMLRDPVVKGVTLAIKLPIIGVSPSIEPASDDNEDIRIAQEVESNLFKNDYFTYGQWIRNILEYLVFGFVCMTKQYEVTDGRWRWRKWKYLKPETIEKWFIDSNGDLAQIEQLAYDPSTGNYGTFTIPENPNGDLDNPLFHIANEQEGDNYRGISILRSAYRSWLMKDRDMRRMGIQSQRGAVGVPMAEFRSGYDDSLKSDVINRLQNLNVHEKGYAIKTRDVDLSFFGGKDFFGFDLIPGINLHNQEIVNAVLANFIIQGQNATGSYAKQAEDIDFFQKAIEAHSNFIEDAVNNGTGKMQHVKQFVRLNHANVKKFPKYRIAKIKEEGVVDLLAAAEKAANIGIFTPTEADEAVFREKAGWPLTEEKIKTGKPKLIDSGYPYVMQRIPGRGKHVTPELVALERRILDLAKIEGTLDNARDRIKIEARMFRNAMVKGLVKRARSILSSSKSVNDVRDKLQKTLVTNKKAMVDYVVSEAKGIFKDGRKIAREEINKQLKGTNAQGDPIAEDASEAIRSLRPTVEAEIDGFVAKIKKEFDMLVLTQFKAGSLNTEAIKEGLSTGRISQGVFEVALTKVSTEAFGLGRTVEQMKEKDKIKRIIRSEVLDESTCINCTRVDGLEFSGFDDPAFGPFSTGTFQECDGGQLCRGLNIVETI